MDADKQFLMLKVTQGRGEVWLNGYSLGRYWNITRDGTSPTEYSQQYYHLPVDFLIQDSTNYLLFFSSRGGQVPESSELFLTWLEPTQKTRFEDQVGFLDECIL
tara:strand:- start:165 stop:476 length:312 start_codon:yes stop_codon:yes gene_type:complete